MILFSARQGRKCDTFLPSSSSHQIKTTIQSYCIILCKMPCHMGDRTLPRTLPFEVEIQSTQLPICGSTQTNMICGFKPTLGCTERDASFWATSDSPKPHIYIYIYTYICISPGWPPPPPGHGDGAPAPPLWVWVGWCMGDIEIF